jgi:hypothetical protein
VFANFFFVASITIPIAGRAAGLGAAAGAVGDGWSGRRMGVSAGTGLGAVSVAGLGAAAGAGLGMAAVADLGTAVGTSAQGDGAMAGAARAAWLLVVLCRGCSWTQRQIMVASQRFSCICVCVGCSSSCAFFRYKGREKCSAISSYFDSAIDCASFG